MRVRILRQCSRQRNESMIVGAYNDPSLGRLPHCDMNQSTDARTLPPEVGVGRVEALLKQAVRGWQSTDQNRGRRRNRHHTCDAQKMGLDPHPRSEARRVERLGELAERSDELRQGTAPRFKRAFDLLLAVGAIAVLIVPAVVLALMVKVTSPGPALYWSDRVGRHNRVFRMPKFRSMSVNTPAIATHLLLKPSEYLTPIGGFLRKTSLDELPQLWSIFRGDMSFVGPRPALFNQLDLIELRTELGVDELTPGLTGWAQVGGRDDLPIPEKARLDAEYLQRHTLRFDIQILWMTALKVAAGENVSH